MIGLISYERKARRIRKSILESTPREIIENGCRIDNEGKPRLTANIAVIDSELSPFLANIAGEEIVVGLAYQVRDNLKRTTLLSQKIPLHIFPWNYKTSRIIGGLIARKVAETVVTNPSYPYFEGTFTRGRIRYTGIDPFRGENPLIDAVVCDLNV